MTVPMCILAYVLYACLINRSFLAAMLFEVPDRKHIPSWAEQNRTFAIFAFLVSVALGVSYFQIPALRALHLDVNWSAVFIAALIGSAHASYSVHRAIRRGDFIDWEDDRTRALLRSNIYASLPARRRVSR